MTTYLFLITIESSDFVPFLVHETPDGFAGDDLQNIDIYSTQIKQTSMDMSSVRISSARHTLDTL